MFGTSFSPVFNPVPSLVIVRKPLEDIYSYQTTSCVQREKEKEGEQGVGSGLLVLCSAANAANAACTSPPGQGPLHYPLPLNARGPMSGVMIIPTSIICSAKEKLWWSMVSDRRRLYSVSFGSA